MYVNHLAYFCNYAAHRLGNVKISVQKIEYTYNYAILQTIQQI